MEGYATREEGCSDAHRFGGDKGCCNAAVDVDSDDEVLGDCLQVQEVTGHKSVGLVKGMPCLCSPCFRSTSAGWVPANPTYRSLSHNRLCDS